MLSMRSLSGLFAGAMLAIATTNPAKALTLDFTSVGSGFLGVTSIVLPEAIVTTPDGNDLFIGAGGIGNSICGITFGNCQGDLNFDFTSEVSDLVFETGGFDPGDSTLASIFDGGNSLLSSINIASNTTVDFTGFSGISRLFLADSSTGAGFSYGNFNFDPAQAVPEPTSLALLGLGLAGIGLATRRRRKS